MYILTDYSKKELSLMVASFDASINEKKDTLKKYNSYGDDLSLLMKNHSNKLRGEITALIECKVRALTAFGMVTEREKTLSN